MASSPANARAANVGFVQVRGWHFMVDGQRSYFAGTNSYHQMIHRAVGRPGPDEVFDAMAARSMNLVRTWAFQDLAERGDCLLCAPAGPLPSGQRPIDYLNESTLAGLDQTLAAADVRGIRVVLTLVNNWDDYGGMNRWTLWRFGTPDHDRFYTDATIRGWFKELILALVNRVNTVNGRAYRDDPTIFAWQLTNEARLMSGSATAADLNAWIGEMSGYIKSVDPNHLVSTGIEGFYGPTNAGLNSDSWMSVYGQDFRINHQHATIDYATCHLWPQNWGWNPIGSPASAQAKAGQFIQRRLGDAQDVLNKPLIMEEFGVPRDNFGQGINGGSSTIRQQFYANVFYGLCESSARINGPFGGTANWMILDNGASDYDDGNGVFLPSDAGMDAIITAHARWLTRLPNPDLNLDGRLDAADAERLQACQTGPGVGPPAAGCEESDQDRDGDVDQSDFGVVQRCLTPPGTSMDLRCSE